MTERTGYLNYDQVVGAGGGGGGPGEALHGGLSFAQDVPLPLRITVTPVGNQSQGFAWLSDDTRVLLTQAVVIDVNNVGVNGLDVGAPAADTWYLVYLVGEDSFVVSTDQSPPVIPAPFTAQSRPLAAFRTNATGTGFIFHDEGERGRWNYRPANSSRGVEFTGTPYGQTVGTAVATDAAWPALPEDPTRYLCGELEYTLLLRNNNATERQFSLARDLAITNIIRVELNIGNAAGSQENVTVQDWQSFGRTPLQAGMLNIDWDAAVSDGMFGGGTGFVIPGY